MKVLKAIGNFFVKIWKWIVKTAWIQPLLIVGLLFGVIFSIPPIVEAIRNSGSESNPQEFLEDQSLSWDSINNTPTMNSNVEKFIHEVSNAVQDGRAVNGYNQRFFLTFSQTGCSACGDLSKSMSKLSELWNKAGGLQTTNSNESFKVYNIKADHTLDSPKEIDFFTSGVTNKDLWAFNTLMLNGSGLPEFVEEVSNVGMERDFYLHGGVTSKASYESSIEELFLSTSGGSDITSFKTPLILVMDFTAEGLNYSGGTGIREVMFGVQVADAYKDAIGEANKVRGQAQFLMDAWNGKGAFTFDNN